MLRAKLHTPNLNRRSSVKARLGNGSLENVRFWRLDQTSELNTGRFLRETTALNGRLAACDTLG